MTAPAPWRVVGLCFDHMHMGDLLTKVLASPAYELVGTYDTQPERMADVCRGLGIAAEIQHDEWRRLLDETSPDLAIVCSPTSEHGQWAERLAARGIHVLLEKPFAVSAEDALRAIRATEAADVRLAVNWPLAWYPPHRTTRRLIAEGVVGQVREVHYYDGNRGPQYHVHAKKSVDPAPEDVAGMWWFSRAAGGGSLLDYLGYGATIATWFRDGELPTEVTAVAHLPTGLEVDVQSVAVARYEGGLSTFQTRWGTFTDPWVHQPQPFCGFVVVGTDGTVVSRDYADVVTVQTAEHPEGRDLPVDRFDERDDIVGLLDVAMGAGTPVEGPCGWPVSLGGQRLVDAAVASAETFRPVRVDHDEVHA